VEGDSGEGGWVFLDFEWMIIDDKEFAVSVTDTEAWEVIRKTEGVSWAGHISHSDFLA
jgi:hypothetical protein